MNNIFIEVPDFQKTIYWLGLPYLVESSFRGRFYTVFNIDETHVSQELEGKILTKFFLKAEQHVPQGN